MDRKNGQQSASSAARSNEIVEFEQWERFIILGFDLLIIADFDGRIVWATPAWEGAFGWSAAELVGRRWTDFAHPEERAIMAGEAMRLLSGDEIKSFEGRFARKDGKYGWLSWKAQPYSAEQRVYCAASDDTKQKEAAERLQRQEERLRMGLEVGRLGTWRYDPQTDLVELDERMKQILGRDDRQFFTLENYLKSVHPHDRPRVRASIVASLDPMGHGGCSLEHRVVLENGQERWLAANGRAQFRPLASFKQAVSYIGTALDITDQKRAQDTLLEREKQFRTLADCIPTLAWMAEADGRIVWYNRRWYEYTNTTPEQMQGWGWQSVHHSDTLPRVLERWQASLLTGEPFEMSLPLRSADGHFRRFLTRVMPLRNAEGEVVRWFGTNTDIEEQMRAQELLEEANRLKDEFLATLSHELRTPLTSILGWASMLGSGELTKDEAQKAIETIARNARVQVQLIDDLLDVSRIMTGKLRLEFRLVNIPVTVETAVNSVRPAAEAKGLRLNLDIDSEVPDVCGDAARLQQVFWNLLTNAVKFTPPGGRVFVRLRRDRADVVEFSVADTGRGIDPEFLPYVFHRFRQEDMSSTRAQAGLGLGLSIVRQIVELHGGSVCAHSPGLGAGATFVVELPIAAQAGLCDQKDTPTVPAPLDPTVLAGLRILLVEDEEDAREFLCAVLERSGASVTSASSAREGLLRYEEGAYDLLLTDLGMPDQDGYELLRAVRATEATRGAKPVAAIALTAFAGSDDRATVLESGFQAHVSKPIEPANLVGVVARFRTLSGD